MAPTAEDDTLAFAVSCCWSQCSYLAPAGDRQGRRRPPIAFGPVYVYRSIQRLTATYHDGSWLLEPQTPVDGDGCDVFRERRRPMWKVARLLFGWLKQRVNPRQRACRLTSMKVLFILRRGRHGALIRATYCGY